MQTNQVLLQLRFFLLKRCDLILEFQVFLLLRAEITSEFIFDALSFPLQILSYFGGLVGEHILKLLLLLAQHLHFPFVVGYLVIHVSDQLFQPVQLCF